MLKPHCPNCHSKSCDHYASYETQHNGTRKFYRCNQCRQLFSETKGSVLEGFKKPISLIVQVLTARTEGMGLNVTCRVFNLLGFNSPPLAA